MRTARGANDISHKAKIAADEALVVAINRMTKSANVQTASGAHVFGDIKVTVTIERVHAPALGAGSSTSPIR